MRHVGTIGSFEGRPDAAAEHPGCYAPLASKGALAWRMALMRQAAVPAATCPPAAVQARPANRTAAAQRVAGSGWACRLAAVAAAQAEEEAAQCRGRLIVTAVAF